MYLVTGGSGQLGQSLRQILPVGKALFPTRSDLDMASLDSINAYISAHPDITHIINCAAYTQVDKAETDTALATLINSQAVEVLAKTGLPVIHISTDYVFNGQGFSPYSEDAATAPINIYGKSKRDGEQKLLAANNKAIIIRTSWLYSEYGHNFLKTMVKLMAEKEALTIVADQIGTPTYCGDLARAICAVLDHGITEDVAGIYHYSNEGVASWYDFAYDIAQNTGSHCALSPVPTSAYPTPAKRPHYSVLSKEKIKQTFGITIPHWREGVSTCLKNLS